MCRLTKLTDLFTQVKTDYRGDLAFPNAKNQYITSKDTRPAGEFPAFGHGKY